VLCGQERQSGSCDKSAASTHSHSYQELGTDENIPWTTCDYEKIIVRDWTPLSCAISIELVRGDWPPYLQPSRWRFAGLVVIRAGAFF